MKFLLPLVLGSVLTLSLCADECSSNDCNNRGKFVVGGDWLYWKTVDTQLSYGSNTIIDATDSTLNIEAVIERPEFAYSSGYRVYAKYQPCNFNWDAALIFTHMPSNSSNFTDTASVPMMTQNFIQLFNANFPLLSILSGAPLTSLASDWDTSISYLDLDFSRDCFSRCDLIIAPHFGLRGYYEKQDFILAGAADPSISFISVMDSKISAFGVQGGVKASWNIWNGFSFIGNFGGAILYTRTHVSGSLIADSIDDALDADISYKDSVHYGLTMVDAFIGLEYAVDFRCTSMRFHVGWEQHNIYESSDFSFTGIGCLTMQGLTLGGEVSF